MTVPPPPAVPGELMRRAAEALRASLVSGARRDALTEAIEAIEALDPDDEGNGWGAAIDAATETLTVLRDATAPRGPLAATEPGQTPVPGIPGSPERSQGHSGPSACEGFVWIGQSFARCDRCGLPYWEHTHDEQIKRQGPFSADWVLVPITPEQAAATKRKWEPTR